MDQQLDLLQPAPPGRSNSPQVVTAEGLALRYWPLWLADAATVLEQLRVEVPWKQEQITLFGKTHPIPRLTCWMGDPGCHYTYSGVRTAEDFARWRRFPINGCHQRVVTNKHGRLLRSDG